MKRTMRQETKIFSVFGEVEKLAAEIMIERHGLHKIPLELIPPGADRNIFGQRAYFAVVVPARFLREFEEVIRNTRA